MQSFQLHICGSSELLVDQMVACWRQWSTDDIADHGSFRVALSGGSTPKQLYGQLAQTPGLNWGQTLLAWGDERYVPADHPDSNYRMAREALIDQIEIPADNILPWPTQAQDPAKDAAHYAQTLQSHWGSELPVFDLLLLGVGPDGHTASLFPGTAALNVTDSITTVGSKQGEPRLTLTYPLINASRRVVFLVAGSNKAEIMRQLLTTAPQLPAQRVRSQGSLIWMLDRSAAAQLPLTLDPLTLD